MTPTSHRQGALHPTRLLILILLLATLPTIPATHDPTGSITPTNSKLPLPASAMGTAYDGQRYIYLFGGWTTADAVATGANTRIDRIVRYDTLNDQALLLLQKLPTSRTLTSAAWDPRSLRDVGCSNGCAYVFGGDASGKDLDEILQVTPSGQVTTLNTRLPVPRLGSVAIWTGEHIYILGGGGSERMQEIWRFDSATQTVKVMGAQLPSIMHLASAVWDNRNRPDQGCPGGCIYLFGGSLPISGNQEIELDLIVQYNPTTDTVRTMNATLPSKRSATAAVWDGTYAYIFGGEYYEFREVVRYDPVADRITVLSLRLDPGRSFLSAVWVGSQAFLLGGTTPARSDDILRFHPPVVNQAPVASFVTSVSQLAVGVDASASSDPEGSALSFLWNWGDGASSVGGPLASHAYAQAGTYTIQLTVTDAAGSTGGTTRTVTLYAPSPANQVPTASFTLTTNQLAVTTNAGASRDDDGTITTYAWDWGDGTTGTGATATHTYTTAGTYTIRLTVTDNGGATASTTRSVTVTAPPPPPNQAPVAAFSTTTNGLTVTTDAAGSYDPDGTITTYAWNWGDGATSTGATASRTYAYAGTYTIRLTVTDNQGATASTTRTLTVSNPPPPPSPEPPQQPAPPPPNQAPVAAFSTTTSGLTVTANAAGSTDSDGTITTYAWTWGDGATSTGPTATHTYAAPGDYTIELTLTDDQGATASTTRTIRATAPSAQDTTTPPDQDASSSTQAPVPVLRLEAGNLRATADASASHAHETHILIYRYVWGDGNLTTTSHPTAAHTYAAPGTYTVRLVVTDHRGNTNETAATVTVHAPAPPPQETPADDEAPSDQAGTPGDAPAPSADEPPPSTPIDRIDTGSVDDLLPTSNPPPADEAQDSPSQETGTQQDAGTRATPALSPLLGLLLAAWTRRRA